MIGYMLMPPDFEYIDVYTKGYPEHEKFDAFRMKHPSMSCSRRAKIFAPFDALTGFNEAVLAKEVIYEQRREISEDDQKILNNRLNILHDLTINSRVARMNKLQVSVTYYVPCTDINHSAFGYRGQYETVSGTCRSVNIHSIIIDDTIIPLMDVVNIESGQDIFNDWYDYNIP